MLLVYIFHGIIDFYFEDKSLLIHKKWGLKKYKPNILTGFNIFSFDLPYLIKRAELYNISQQFLSMGMRKYGMDEVKDVNWSSKAYSKQEFMYINMIHIQII